MREPLLHYFEQQRRLLREGLTEFAREHPHQAQLLGIEPQDISDPQMRALIDGVAFLNGATAQRLDRTAPDLITGLIRVIFPDYLQPVPALLPVTFSPSPEAAHGTVLPADTPFTAPGAHGETVQWRTLTPVELQPLTLSLPRVQLSATHYMQDGRSHSAACSLSVTLTVSAPDLTFAALTVPALTLHFTGEGEHPWLLDDAVHRHCCAVRISTGDEEFILPPAVCERLPLRRSPLTGDTLWSLLHDGLWRPERYLGVTLTIAALLRHCQARTLTAEFLFSEPLPSLTALCRPGEISLFSTVLINRFAHQAEPLSVTPDNGPQRICTDTRDALTLCVVEQVTDITTLPAVPVAQIYHDTAAPAASPYCWQAVYDDDGAVTHLSAIVSGTTVTGTAARSAEAETAHTAEGERLWVIAGQATQGETALHQARTAAITCQRAEPLAYTAAAVHRPLIMPLPVHDSPAMLFMRHRRTRLCELVNSPQGAAPLKALLALYDRHHSPVLTRLMAAIRDVTAAPEVTVRFYQHLPLTVTGLHITVTLAQNAPEAGTAFLGMLLDAVFTSLLHDNEFIRLTLCRQEDVREAYHYPAGFRDDTH